MTRPEWLDKYKLTAADRQQNAEIALHLMGDQQTTAFAVRAVSDLYKTLCGRRSSLAAVDPQDLAWAEDHESGIIDRVVGAALVIVQGEIARVSELVRHAYGALGPSLEARAVRQSCSSSRGGYSMIELIHELANLFKHDDDLAAALARLPEKQPRPQQQHTLGAVAAAGCPLIPLIYHPGELERCVGEVFVCSRELGLLPVADELERWRRQWTEQIRKDIAGHGT